MTIKVDIRPSGVESGVVAAQFDKAVAELHNNGYDVISLPVNAQLRIEHGRDSFVTRNGNYTGHAIAYARGAQPLFVRASPLVTNLSMAEQAVEANRQGQYFSTEKAFYDQNLEIAKADRGKEPIDRRVLVLPSREKFEVSSRKNPETFNGMIGQSGKDYLKAMGLKHLAFYPIEIGTVDGQDGTLLTELWFGRHGDFNRSGLYGYYRYLDCDNRVRGVRQVSGEAAQKISEGSQSGRNNELPYSPAQVREYASLVEDVRSGKRPNADLEGVLTFFKELRTEQ